MTDKENFGLPQPAEVTPAGQIRSGLQFASILSRRRHSKLARGLANSLGVFLILTGVLGLIIILTTWTNINASTLVGLAIELLMLVAGAKIIYVNFKQ